MAEENLLMVHISDLSKPTVLHLREKQKPLAIGLD